jgi:DNA-binding NtrC family response regulator
MITAYGSTETTIEAIRMGAFDYIHKPFDIPEMLRLIEKGLESSRFMGQHVDIGPEIVKTDREALIGRSPAMLDVYKAIGRVAPTDATVLIRGESGTGKELAARAVYQHSLRSKSSFLVINCVAIPENLLESELFGYEKGSFTGAVHRRVGKIEQANKGTILLDEIGDMPLSTQAKILRLLQDKSIERLGGREVIPVDVRIIAATNRDLEKAVTDGSFREDLYYRLNVVLIRLPPLRERLSDVPLLVDYFLTRFSQELSIENPGITPEALKLLQEHQWPGNVRELANVLQKTLILHCGGPIREDDLVLGNRDSQPHAPELTAEDTLTDQDGLKRLIRSCLTKKGDAKLFDTCLDQFASLLIQEALKMSNGNKSQAAKLLGLSRPTLHYRIEKYGIRIESQVSDSEE